MRDINDRLKDGERERERESVLVLVLLLYSSDYDRLSVETSGRY